ncbi:unnamed protein product [Auanema sp. JU1783]|nr:unnamed protein product [Auanema sp. JU1783]
MRDVLVSQPITINHQEEKNMLNNEDYLLSSIFNHPNIRIKNKVAVEEKLLQMMRDGQDKLMVITDFDFTLTKFDSASGERFWSSPGIFDRLASEIRPSLVEKFKQLCKKYIPIEFDPKLSMEEKIPHMESFWKESHRLTVSAGFEKNVIEEFVRRSKIALRDGTTQLMENLSSNDIPMVIFSAGVGDVIDVFLRKEMNKRDLPENMHIISNMMEFDNEGIVTGFSEPLIHTFCKNSSVIQKEAAFFHQIAERTNVILLGDSLGDIHMDVGVEKEQIPLKIGFLNYKVDELIDTFTDIYDIVLIRDRSMTVPSAILRSIQEHEIIV